MAPPMTLEAYSAGAFGDFNADGYSDFVFTHIPSSTATKVIVFWGNDGGTQEIYGPLLYDPTLTNFGQSIANAGDVDGDGFDDLLVATNNTSSGVGQPRTAFLYYGSDGGLLYGLDGGAYNGSPVRFDLNPQLSSSAYVRTLFVRGVGDVDGDGIPDSLFLESKAKDGGISGQAFLWLGSRTNNSVTCQSSPNLPECKRPATPNGVDVARIDAGGMVTINGADNSTTICGDAGTPLVYEIGGRFIGSGGIGDVNGDGKMDFYIASSLATNAGRGWIFLGKSFTPGATISLSQADVRVEAFGSTWGDVPALGLSLAGLGRVSGSSGAACSPQPCDDFAIGSDGKVYILYGRNAWPSEICMDSAYQPVLTYTSAESDAGNAGFSLAGVSDVTGDGRRDLVVGSSGMGAFLYFGTGDGGVPFGVTTSGKPDVSMLFTTGGLNGTWVRNVSDWNKDGYFDFLIATSASNGSFYLKY
jgi:hypothetical protein